MLKSIVYIGTSRHPLTCALLESACLERSRWQTQLDLTGALLFNGRDFMECIEGPTGRVDAHYASVGSVSQYMGVVSLLQEPVRERAFDLCYVAARPLRQSKVLRDATSQWQDQGARADHPRANLTRWRLLERFWRRSR